MPGYSNTKLIDKLGVKPGFRIYIKNAPENYFEMLGKLPDGIQLNKKICHDTDFIHFFTMQRSALEKNFLIFKSRLSKSGLLWISWPKNSSGVKTDLSENIIREIGLRTGLVDVKVCAIDEIWSGLKFVFRLKDRK